MALRNLDHRSFASAQARAGGRRAWLAVLPALALLVLAASASASAHAVRGHTRPVDALTRTRNAAELTSQRVCAPATPTRSTCEARILVTAHGHAPVHPRLTHPRRVVVSDARSALASHDSGTASEPQAGSPAYVQQAYDLSYLSQYGGVGDTVAIVDAYDDPTAEADLASYRAYFGLPACTTANGCFRKVDQSGGQSFPSQAPGWAAEISLDLDAVSAICPHCNILLVEANSAGNVDLATAQAEAAALGARQITDSWGDPSATPMVGTFTFPGVATVAATGDQGYLGLVNSQYPAALPGVTAAGGTTLTPADGPRGFSEQAWKDAGSGCALLSAKPAWQSDGGCGGRTYSDLSANADPQTGLDVYDSSNGGWVVMGGTSESAPLIAAYYAITGASAATPAWAYENRALLNAPVGGSNGACQASIAYICVAGGGYNGPTGVGSISGAVVPGAPGIGGPGSSGSYTGRADDTSAQLRAGIYPNGSDTTYLWQYGTTTAYGQTTSPADAGAGQAPVTISSTLSGLLPDTTYHYRLAARNRFGTTFGYDFTLKTPGSSATALTAVQVSGRIAKVRGTVNAPGGAATYRFAYGTGLSYSHSTSAQTAWGTRAAHVSATLTGLAPHTRYHVRLVVTGPGVPIFSAPRTFTTGNSSRERAGRRRAPGR